MPSQHRVPRGRPAAPFAPLAPSRGATAAARYTFGGFRLDPLREQLLAASGPRPLRRQALAVLCVLVQRAPALVAIDELLDLVWGHRAISSSALPQAIRDLRRALGDDARRPTYIETRQRRGYRLLPSVSMEATASGVAGDTAASPIGAIATRPAANDDAAR